MATRLYLQDAAPGYTPASWHGHWEYASGGTNTRGLGIKSGASNVNTGYETNSSPTWDVQLCRFISGPLPSAKTITAGVDLFSYCIGFLQSSNQAAFYPFIHVWATVGDSDTERGVILSNHVGPTVFPTTAAGVGEAGGLAATGTVAMSAGDRIVVEVGYRATNTKTTSYGGTIYFGTTGATDLTNGDTAVGTNPGWVEFSQDGLFSISVSMAGALASSGGMARSVSKKVAGALASAGTASKSLTKLLAGALSSAASISIFKSATFSVAGTLASSAVLSRLPRKYLAGVLGTAGTAKKTFSKAFAGALGLAASASTTLVRLFSVAGVLSFFGDRSVGYSYEPYFYVYLEGGSKGTHLSSANRKIDVEIKHIARAHRLADGSFARKDVAKKRVFNFSWEYLPYLDASTPDTGMGAGSVEALASSTGVHILQIPGDGDCSRHYRTLVVADSFKKSLALKRASGATYWNISLSLQEV